MSIHELQRQAYLEKMGVQQYFPRVNLPGAPLSELCVLPEGVQWPITAGSERVKESVDKLERTIAGSEPVINQPGAQLEEATTQANNEKARSQLDSLLAGNGKSQPEARSEQSRGVERNKGKEVIPDAVDSSSAFTDSSLSSPSLASSVFHFQLALVRLNNGLFILSHYPKVANGQFPASQQRLLWQVLRSNGVDLDGQDLTIQLFQWPMLNMVGLDNNAEAGRLALQAFLESNAQSLNLKTLLLFMNDSLVEALFPLLQGAEKAEFQQSEALNCQVLQTFSLDQVMKVPALKSDLWKSLRPLRKA